MENIEGKNNLLAVEPQPPVCASILRLPTESVQALDALLASLTTEYQPETEIQNFLIRQAARSAWELDRLNREFDKSQQKLLNTGKSMCNWEAAEHTEYQCMFRYRAAAERSFHRSLASVEHLRKLRIQAAARAFSEKQQLARLELAQERLKLAAERLNQMRLHQKRLHETRVSHVNERAAKPEKPAKEPPPPASVRPPTVIPLSQMIVVFMLDGITSIKVHPLSEEMILQSGVTGPDTPVLRHFEFPNGVPAEYTWVNGPRAKRSGNTWTQYFATVQSWREHLEWEASTANGRFLPIRPREPASPELPQPQ